DQSTLNNNHLDLDINFLEANVLKWITRSYKSAYKDDSYMFGHRTHIGAQWALTALYLYYLTDDVDNKAIYDEIATKYSNALRFNFRTNKLSLFSSAYTWNSTWDTQFSERLRRETN